MARRYVFERVLFSKCATLPSLGPKVMHWCNWLKVELALSWWGHA